MNKTAQRFIRVGAKGTFLWLSEKCERPENEDWVETKRTSGTFEIVKVRSQDFIVDVLCEDGTKRTNVFCAIPSKKKTTVDEAGNVTMGVFYWTETGFKQREVDNRVGGFSYAFTREMDFTA